ncbi:CPBP family intramembrane glutamic endopeptidase [Kitasatospora sp. NPDC056138]|uniref:CPBP family intramembrane glutamic endopeptidase n=1 Tax=Kitasatospora sp. NPDC056138 TaxID=3345724 RepID=UPI0035DAB465
MALSTSLRPPAPPAARRRALLVYLGLAYAGMWAAMSPLLAGGFQRGDAREDPGALEQACIAAAMFAPALAAVLVVRFVERDGTRVRDALALRLPRPLTRAVSACLLPVGVLAALTAAVIALGTLAGSYPFAGLDALTAGGVTGWAVQGLVGMLVSLPLFFGEELGWQGFLFPRLLRAGGTAGLVRAYVLTGGAFALWHLPTLLMGGQYPGRPWYVAVPALTVSCVLVLPVFTWLRLRSGSVVPAVFGHAFASTLGVATLKEFADPDATLDPLTMGLAGWPGWVVTGTFVAFLALTGRLRPSHYEERDARRPAAVS